jgi:glycosyltransferase involved in cell wall biosynthesis
MPKVLHISFSPSGGAGIAAGNLSRAIEAHTSWQSELITFHPSNLWLNPSADILATATSAIDEFLVKKTNVSTAFSLFRTSQNFSKAHLAQIQNADIVHLHWVEGLLHGEFLGALMEKRPGSVFYTLHDMRPFTGGCHFAGHCEGFRTSCTDCPIVRSVFKGHVAGNFVTRSNILKQLSPVFVTPGEWMRERFLESTFRDLSCYTIPYALSASAFAISDKAKRQGSLKLGFIAAKLNDQRKGLVMARKQVRELVHAGLDLTLQLVGSDPPSELEPWEQYVGFLGDAEIREWLIGLDFLVFTSLNDNAPLVVSEALAAGTPILIAQGTGADHMVSLGVDSLDLFSATIGDLKQEQTERRLSKGARNTAKEFSPIQAAQRIVLLYEEKSISIH